MPTPTTSYQNGYWTEGNVVDGTNVGGGQFVAGPPPTSTTATPQSATKAPQPPGVALTPPYQSPTQGGPVSSAPVSTASKAQADFAAKKNALDAINTQIQLQGAQKANQQQLEAQAQAQADLQASEKNMKQQGINIQQSQADTAASVAKSKQDAINMASGQTLPAQGQNIAQSQTSQQPIQGQSQAVGALNTIDKGMQSATSNYLQSKQDITSQVDNLVNSTVSNLNNIRNGTVPLTAPQQALITSLQTQLQQNVQLQQQANASYEGATKQSLFRSGGEYTPEHMAGAIQNAVSTGLAKVQQLDNAAALTIAQLHNQFDTQNYEMVNKNYDLLMNQLDRKSNAIQDTYKTVTSQLTAQREFYQKQADKDIQTSRDMAVSDLMQQGITDPGELLSALNEQGGDFTAEDIQTTLKNLVPPGMEAKGLMGEYEYYTKQETAEGRVPLSFMDFKNYQTNATLGAGINPITGQPISKADQDTNDAVKRQDALDLQTVNGAYESIKGILARYKTTPETVTKEILDNMTDADAENIGKAAARIITPDITRGGTGSENALAPTSVGEKGKQLARSLIGGKQYLPEKVVDVINSAKASKEARQNRYDNPVATQAGVDENAAQKIITDFVISDPTQKEMIAKALETPDPAFGGNPPTHLQLLQAMRKRGLIK